MKHANAIGSFTISFFLKQFYKWRFKNHIRNTLFTKEHKPLLFFAEKKILFLRDVFSEVELINN